MLENQEQNVIDGVLLGTVFCEARLLQVLVGDLARSLFVMSRLRSVFCLLSVFY